MHPFANRDGEGVFVRSDGVEMPTDLHEETLAFLDGLHDDCNKFADNPKEGAGLSVGAFFKREFDQWIEETKV